MAEKTGFVPINEARTSRVTIALDFTNGTPVEQIGVNVGRVHKWCELGGLRTLTIKGSTPQLDTPSIVGFSSSGEAYAARTRTKVATLTQTNLSPLVPGVKYPRAAIWADAVIDFNMEVLHNQVNAQGGVNSAESWSKIFDLTLRQELQKPINPSTGVRSAEGWSQVFNKPLKKEVAKLGATNLLDGITVPGLRIMRSDVVDFVLGFCGAIGFARFPLEEPETYHLFANHKTDVVMAALAGFFVTHMVGNIIGYHRWEFDGAKAWAHQFARMQDDYYRFSIFNGMAFDRWANLKIRSWTQTLVKPING